ncbi:MAG: arsenite methyltransferase [Phycisphaerae bacterium]
MNDAGDVRKQVSAAYADSVRRDGGSCCGGSVAPKGAAAKLAGYGQEEFAALPAEAVVNSFGCGNPVALSGLQAGDVVLDLGSGAGIDVLLAAKKVGPTGRVIGVDMTEEMIAKARQNIAEAGLTQVEIRQGIIEQLPVESDSVDWVISNCVINLSPEKPKVFAEIARVLKPGGRMLVSDLVVKELPDWVRDNALLYSSCIAGAIGEDEYVQGLRDAGLADVEVRGRWVYEPEAVIALVESELPPAAEGGPCGCHAGGPVLLDRAAKELAGKVWSANFYGRKAD